MPTSALVTATGNNLILEGDMTRRSVRCELDAKVERPELREFNVQSKTVFRQRRGEFVSAPLTILRAPAGGGARQLMLDAARRFRDVVALGTRPAAVARLRRSLRLAPKSVYESNPSTAKCMKPWCWPGAIISGSALVTCRS